MFNLLSNTSDLIFQPPEFLFLTVPLGFSLLFKAGGRRRGLTVIFSIHKKQLYQYAFDWSNFIINEIETAMQELKKQQQSNKITLCASPGLL